ncbi:FAD-binding domain-containing protein [Dendrothele bispora CBS 962.96]|uniref:FAD-binding domain-containing protein n=1 Tax=Dendrothele bispora (strain CBS 962.96) TaxID=1314807 RepID=A0A4V4HBR1_DENBC|nr:FAD-binding domain-containing protein [Dendrothele bispora CBS 962.96]
MVGFSAASWFGILSLALSAVADRDSSNPACKALPSDADWPTRSVWNAFNASVDGRLIRTVPIASPCHNPTFDAEKCQSIRDNWHEVSLHLPSSSSVMTPFFANDSCDPFTAPDAPCVIGSYIIQYAVNVSTKAHVLKTTEFARNHNIRFVLRNTGHDYLGKSTGKGGLAIWTHYLQDTQWIENYQSTSYHGPAIKASAGVSVNQMYDLAAKKGYAVVGGDCLTVGFTGGYIQGAGHSSLTSVYGLAADSALEYEVITTDGRSITASPSNNSDLYWALSGGGGGTYGVVWSVTVKVHPDLPVTVANMSFSATGISQDLYWEAVSAYLAFTPSFTDAGGYGLATYSQASFRVAPLFTPNKTVDEVNALTSPLRSKLDDLRINYTYATASFPGFRSAFAGVPGYQDEPIGVFNFGGRLLPRELFTNSSLPKTVQVLRNITAAGALGYDIAMRATVKDRNAPPNAVLPAWRSAEKLFITLVPWNDTATHEQMLAARSLVTNVIDPPLHQLAPNSGTYLNEADSNEPDWQNSFYGENYGRLLSIKDKYDPDQILYGSTAVGGDRWAEDSDGRLCRISRADHGR